MSAAVILILTAAGLAGGAHLLEKRDKRTPFERARAEQKSCPCIIELSNFAALQQAALKATRKDAYDEALRAHKTRLECRREAMKTHAEAIKEAWGAHQPIGVVRSAWRWCRSAATWSFAPQMAKAGLQEKMWSIGQEGESALTAALVTQFDSHWTIVAGFRNRKGEIDRLLIGPGGVFAFEVKHYSGRIFCNGDKWWRDKENRQGHTVECGLPIADRGGRGPSRQLNEPADQLQLALQRVREGLLVTRVVVFTNPRASFGDLINPPVHFIATLDGLDMAYVVSRAETVLDARECREVIKRVHRQHEASNAERLTA